MQKAPPAPVSPNISEYGKLLSDVFESSLELINASARIDKLLLAGEEGMALRADFNSYLAALGRLRRYGFAAGTANYTLFIIGMNSGFHFSLPRFFYCDVL